MALGGAEPLKLQVLKLSAQTWCARVEGPITDHDIQLLESIPQRMTWHEGARLIINLESIGVVSFEGLRWFLRVHFAGVRDGVRVILAACPPPLEEILKQTGLAKLLRFTASEASALEG